MDKKIALLGAGLISPATLLTTKATIDVNNMLVERREAPETQYVKLLSTDQSYNQWLLQTPSASKAIDNNRYLHADAAALCQFLYAVTSKKAECYYTKSFSEKRGYWISVSDIDRAKIKIHNPNINSFCNELKSLPLVNDKCGFYSKCMLHIKEEMIEEIAYVTKGTDFTTIRDWNANFEQGWSGDTQQYSISESNAKKIRNLKRNLYSYNKEIPLYFIGHSLGGGLATRNAVVTGLPAITFNAASLNPHTIAGQAVNYKTLMKERKLLSFYMEGEVLSSKASDYVGLPKPGHRIRISMLEDKKRNSVDLHDIKHMCNFWGLKSFVLYPTMLKYLCF